jgi:hypothetical protein
VLNYILLVFLSIVAVSGLLFSKNKRVYDGWNKNGGKEFAVRMSKNLYLTSFALLITSCLWLLFELITK